MWTRNYSSPALVCPETLRFCLRERLNVLLEGPAGVGKTAVVVKAFQEEGLKLLVLSGATMDPWVDFVGVPRPVARPDGSHVLDLVRRPELVDDSVDAVFIDEFNRAPAKARNAAMELIQFKSVNGQALSRLSMVWAAINPDDDLYDVERLDPAQQDRFHVRLKVPYRPCPRYFMETYGSAGKAALEWWDAQGESTRKSVSPRRLEYALQIALKGGPVRHVLPQGANVHAFLSMLDEGPVFDQLKTLRSTGNVAAARDLLADPIKGSLALQQIVKSRVACLFFLPLLPIERLVGLLDEARVREWVVLHAGQVPEFHNALLTALACPEKTPLQQKILATLKRHDVNLAKSPSLLPKQEPPSEAEIASMDPYGRLADGGL